MEAAVFDHANIKNLPLVRPADWMAHPDVLPAINEANTAIASFFADDGLEDPIHVKLRELISEPVREVFTAPILSEAYCKMLLDEVRNMSFEVNEEEDAPRQIPELLLAKLPLVNAALIAALRAILDPIVFTLWHRQLGKIHAQIANYNPRSIDKTAWHHDQSSDFTVVIPLNTGQYVGGGTEFCNRGIVPPLPIGHGVIFPATTHLHRGLPVTEGDRFLLVLWTEKDHG